MRKVMVLALFAILTTAVSAEWMVGATEDLMSGTSLSTATLMADAHQGTLAAPVLVIREGESGYSVFIHWGGFNIDRDTESVVVKVGDSEPSEWYVRMSTSREATFFVSWKRLIAAMLDAEGSALIAQTVRATGVTSIARFQLSGLSDALMQMGY